MLLEVLEVETLRQMESKILDLYHIDREAERKQIGTGILHEINLAQKRNLITDEAREALSWILHTAIYG